ncbi:MAG: TlpA family protein disulfide reductase [Betaproteobacteria bacterium]|nr:TlpA family protein disulfide reductase [Betaproteobacteria bacterium]
MIRCVRRLALLSLVLPMLALASTDGKALKVKPGDIPPESLGATRFNESVKTTDFSGKVLVTTFWASWCGPCKAEMAALEKIQKIAKEKVQVVAVNIENREDFRNATRRMHDWEMKITNDPRKTAADEFGVGGIPHMLIIGRDGKVQKVHRGYSEAFLKVLIEDVIAAIGE